MSHFNTVLMTLSFLLLLATDVNAQVSNSAKASKRWTLQEWLNTKNRNALMDQWLQMNSPSPYEFFLKGESFNYDSQVAQDPKKSYISRSVSAAAYASIVGLQAEYENNTKEQLNDVTGLIHFRILGDALQSTSLILSAGQRTRQFEYLNQDRSVKNLAAQAQVSLYITKYFGLKGLYRHYQPTDDNSLGQIQGHLTESGIFIDFSQLRVFGDYFEDSQKMSPSGIETKIRRLGIKTGLQFFF